MTAMPECFYRVSVKALVLNDTRDGFLALQDEKGKWELPGGGLDWGSGVREELQREIAEKMGLPVTLMAKRPAYFFTFKRPTRDYWYANVVYEATLEHLQFTPSDECVAVQFFVPGHDYTNLHLSPNVSQLLNEFDPARHQT